MANKENFEIDFRSPEAAPILLGLGTAIWKTVAWVSDIDFLMSINNQTFATIFQFFLNHGWWLLLLICVVWGYQVHKESKNKPPQLTWGMVISVGILTFLSGILITVYATGSVPRVVIAWGGGNVWCNGTVNTARLVSFRGNYKVALACWKRDSTIDVFDDERVIITKAFNITGGTVQMTAPVPQELSSHYKTGAVSHYAVMIPKDIDLGRFKRLYDILQAGGRIIHPSYYD